MALTIKIDAAQMEQLAKLTQAINNLSDNLAKWQGEQTRVIGQGFTDLVEVFGGTRGEDSEAKISEIANTVKTVKEKLKTSVDSQT